jgi:hypothetical protein
MHNIPFLSLPITGPNAIARDRRVAGVLTLDDGRRVLIGEDECCLTCAGTLSFLWPENVLEAAQS